MEFLATLTALFWKVLPWAVGIGVVGLVGWVYLVWKNVVKL